MFFTILLILTRGLRYSLKEREQQNKGVKILKRGVEVSATHFSGVRRKLHAEIICFFFFLDDKKRNWF